MNIRITFIQFEHMNDVINHVMPKEYEAMDSCIGLISPLQWSIYHTSYHPCTMRMTQYLLNAWAIKSKCLLILTRMFEILR